MSLVTPIKTQGKKTKITDHIAELYTKESIWVEPFLGSGQVLFSIAPERAIVSDTNIHIINFYNGLKNKKFTHQTVREFLEFHGKILSEQGKEYYYEMRSKFNKNHDSLYFLFLNRSCFNGVMRFNSKGEFNVPFCNKDDRFDKSMITRIVNQVKDVEVILEEKGENWIFIVSDWKEIVKEHGNRDDVFFYFDPPYVNRHATYFEDWTEEENDIFFDSIKKMKARFLLSNWVGNSYRNNDKIDIFSDEKVFQIKLIDHFYHVGGNLENRNKMVECLILKL